jgi:hypothetical protein
MAGEHELTTLITADAARELRLRAGDDVVVLLKASQIMILREGGLNSTHDRILTIQVFGIRLNSYINYPI